MAVVGKVSANGGKLHKNSAGLLNAIEDLRSLVDNKTPLSSVASFHIKEKIVGKPYETELRLALNL